MRDRRAAIEAIGSNRQPIILPAYSREQLREFEATEKRLVKEREERRVALEKGIWGFDSQPTPDGHVCAAVFSKFTANEGGVVTMMGFRHPKPEAWVVFHGAKLPKPKNPRKINITFQQGNDLPKPSRRSVTVKR